MIAQLSKNLLTLEEQSQLVQGSVGETLALRLSGDWRDLSATAVFSNGALTRDVIVNGDSLVIPWELLREAGRTLTLSFHGAAANGDVVQTNIAVLGKIRESHTPSGQNSEAPTPAVADQILALAGQALTAASAVKASAEAGAFDGVSPAVSVEAVQGGHAVSITDRAGIHSFTVLDGSGGSAIAVDDALTTWSTNPVQNKVVYQAYAALQDELNTKQDKALFFAEYNETSAAGLEEAIRSELTPVLVLDGKLFPLVSYRLGDEASGTRSSFTFSGWNGTAFTVCVCEETDGSSTGASDWDDWGDGASTVWSFGSTVRLPAPASAAPVMDGAAAVGSSAQYARADHVHPSDSAKADKITEVTVSTAGAVTQALDAGKLYHFTGALTALTITLNAPASGDPAQYHFDFLSGSTAPTLTMPDTVVMPDSFTVEANKRYEVDVLNNYGAVVSWAN